MLGWSPPWLVERLRRARRGRRRAALVDRQPGAGPLRATSTAARVARARMREVVEAGHRLTDGADQLVDRRRSPTRAGRARSSASPTSTGSGRRSRRAVRLDEPDPVAGLARAPRRARRAAPTALNERRFDALRYRGPGTDLTIGLHPDVALAVGAASPRAAASPFVANMPTEEVFTTPDARRVEGTVAATYPLAAAGQRSSAACGSASRAAGPSRCTRTRARTFMRALRRDRRRLREARRGRPRRPHLARRPDRPRLLRHALRRERRVATSRSATAILPAIARGRGLPAEERHARGVNSSSIHTDFMIGSPGGRRLGRRRGTATETPILAKRRLGPAYTLSERDVAQPG